MDMYYDRGSTTGDFLALPGGKERWPESFDVLTVDVLRHALKNLAGPHSGTSVASQLTLAERRF